MVLGLSVFYMLDGRMVINWGKRRLKPKVMTWEQNRSEYLQYLILPQHQITVWK
jgi:hypothetical protein